MHAACCMKPPAGYRGRGLTPAAATAPFLSTFFRLAMLAQIGREQFHFFVRQRTLPEQIGAPLPRPAKRLLEAPGAYRRMMPRKQHVRNSRTIDLLRPRVMRAVEQAS